LATGETHSVREFLDEVFWRAGNGFGRSTLRSIRDISAPPKVDLLLGDPAKAKQRLKWAPKVGFKQLAKMMTDADWALARRERLLVDQGHQSVA